MTPDSSREAPDREGTPSPERTARETIDHLRYGRLSERTVRDVMDAGEKALRDIAVSRGGGFR